MEGRGSGRRRGDGVVVGHAGVVGSFGGRKTWKGHAVICLAGGGDGFFLRGYRGGVVRLFRGAVRDVVFPGDVGGGTVGSSGGAGSVLYG